CGATIVLEAGRLRGADRARQEAG
ncbi:ABC transporter ATP-binding protein, partial [Burkholderia pseudomallei]|nr:ABC transporter ATP-binding protein [Burkholderia pseudomallei]MBF3542779.1 ABC transporter ATP-binding protein [Burkholderia pseudomallei]MBF3604884.1 ABC transporter ATP-binding protein [Burkholderia pseudomallei]MBF3604939.1 ABC transporter ATP-binding protein [Burkholderia pseudomallei]MBF3727484.1 ABC transporter ATP-binding protein [Burkholderia pseudomallei]